MGLIPYNYFTFRLWPISDIVTFRPAPVLVTLLRSSSNQVKQKIKWCIFCSWHRTLNSMVPKFGLILKRSTIGLEVCGMKYLFWVNLLNQIVQILSPVGNDRRTKHSTKLQNYETCFLLRVMIKLPYARSSDMRLHELKAWANQTKVEYSDLSVAPLYHHPLRNKFQSFVVLMLHPLYRLTDWLDDKLWWKICTYIHPQMELWWPQVLCAATPYLAVYPCCVIYQ